MLYLFAYSLPVFHYLQLIIGCISPLFSFHPLSVFVWRAAEVVADETTEEREVVKAEFPGYSLHALVGIAQALLYGLRYGVADYVVSLPAA